MKQIKNHFIFENKKMETTMMNLIKQLGKIDSHVITTDNVINYAKSLLQNERDQMIDIANRYHLALKERGIVTISGDELVNQLYGKLDKIQGGNNEQQ